MSNQLDTFEAQLLHELRSTIDATNQGATAAVRPRVGRPWRRISGAMAAGAAATAAVFVLPGAFASPAFAVQSGPPGTIHVQVNRLDDAPGLRSALARYGVSANIDYLGFDKKCSTGRYVPADSVSNSTTRFSFGDSGISIDLDRRDVTQGQTVVIAAARTSSGVYGEVGIARGPVRPCTPIPLLPNDR